MRVVADTNVLVSALLWSGAPHRLLALAETSRIALYTSPALIDELAGVLARHHFTARLNVLRVADEELVANYLKLAHLVLPIPISPVIVADPDDDAVLACALAADAAYIVSGDPHLLSLKRYHAVHIVSPRTFLTDVLGILH